MKDLQINVQERTAWAETGLTAGEYVAAAAAHGLTTGFGDTSTVGLGGITLGGGVGYLVRKHGLTIDNLLAAEVVTADGELLHVDEFLENLSHPLKAEVEALRSIIKGMPCSCAIFETSSKGKIFTSGLLMVSP
jgi:FAD/FMN-containing dehydrogenase